MKIEVANKEKLEQIKKLYVGAFPETERKPFDFLLQKQKEGVAEVLAIEEEEFLGLIITLLYKDIVLIDYFAIEETARGNGIGSKVLTLIKEKYKGKRIILEIESPNETSRNQIQRVKRKEFYRKNGFVDTGIYIDVYHVDMELLSNQCSVSFEEYYMLLKCVLGSVMLKEINPVIRKKENMYNKN